jgi:putative membrane protein
MERRVVLAGLVAAATSPVLAQQAPVAPIPATPQPTEGLPNQSLGTRTQEREQRTRQGGAPQDTRSQARQGDRSSGSSETLSGQQQSEADARYIQETLAAGTVTLQASVFARDKAQLPRVRQFARFEEEEQNTLADVLHSLAGPSATASTGRTQAATTAPELPAQASSLMERFSHAQAGPDFDRAYVTAQLQGHQDLLRIQERYLEGSRQDPDLAAIARLASGRIREHLARLQALEGQVGR